MITFVVSSRRREDNGDMKMKKLKEGQRKVGFNSRGGLWEIFTKVTKCMIDLASIPYHYKII